MKEICTLLVKLHIIFSRMQRVKHARPSIIQMGCPTCCYQVCALDHANVGTADQDYSSGPCHRNAFTIPSKIMPYYSYPASLVNQNEIPLELSCYRAHLVLIMSLMNMKMLINMTICIIIQDNAMLKLSCKFGESNWNPCWLIMLTSSPGTNYVPNELEDPR